ncbi:MAG: hypothetical protein IJZ42_09600, partial [Lachnospiraceae bacterium]|nr:hypothetical protein [Lachnospiraceae bacterium]
MERNLLKEEIKDIKMSDEMKARILENCRNAGLEKENAFMAKKIATDTNKQKTRKSSTRKWTRIATVAAAVALCLGLGGV